MVLLKNEKVFRDPIHGYVSVKDQEIRALIDTREFQRLRRIKQLGTSHLTFHTAEHSRFSHSLGVYELTRRIIEEAFASHAEWDESERMLALCSGLLHDLGHGPFSHSFEKVFGLDHEEYSRMIILGNTEVNAVLRTVAPDFPMKVASVIEKTYPNKLIISLISSQVDADRMDYLLRDSYYTGVSYGRFDLEKMIRVILPSKDGLLIKGSGMHVVEDYIMSRYQMYRQVYFHPVTSSAEVLLTMIFNRVKWLFHSGYQFKQAPSHFEPVFLAKVSVEDYIRLDEAICLTYFALWQEEADTILADLCRRFMRRNLFKHVAFEETDTDAEKFARLSDLFRQVGIDPTYYLTIHASSNLAYDEYKPGSDDEKQPVSLLLNDGSKEELSTRSTIIAAINGKRNVYKYLYFPKDLICRLPESKEKQQIRQLLGLTSPNEPCGEI